MPISQCRQPSLRTQTLPLSTLPQPFPHEVVCARGCGSMDMKHMDVSRFMLFEATGDSEVDGDADAIMDEQSAGDDDDGDAESCIHEGSESDHDWDLVDQRLTGNKSCVADPEYEHRDGKKNDGGETGVCGTSYCDDGEIQKRQQRSSLSVDSGQQLMDEMEKNRRFWEACLAS